MPRQLPAAEELRGANFLSARIPQWLRDLFHRHRSASRLADGSPMPAYAFAELIWREGGSPMAQPLIPALGVNAAPAAVSFRLTTETYNRLRSDIRASQVPKDQFIARELVTRLRTIRLDLVQRQETPEPVRVVCANTLSLAHRQGAGEGVSIMHKGDLQAKIRQAQEVLGLARRFFDDAAAVIDRLAGYSPTSAQLAAYFAELYPDPEGGKDNARAAKARTELQRLFEEGRGHDQPGVKGTAWAAYNAGHRVRGSPSPGPGANDRDRASRRLNSVWFGSGARLKARAWNLAAAMAGGD